MFVGTRHIQIADESEGVSFPALVMYPTDRAFDANGFRTVFYGRKPGRSHCRWPVPSRNDFSRERRNELEGTHQNLVNRPRHVGFTIDAVFSDVQFRACVQPNNVAVIGHSIGGYTALALAGGTPWSEARQKVEVTTDPRVRALVRKALIVRSIMRYFPAKYSNTSTIS
jgi:hypothetical protein